MLRLAFFRCLPRQHRDRILQLGRRVGRSADFATVAVLVGRPTARTFAANEPVGKKHICDRVKGLANLAPRDMAAGIEALVNLLGKEPIFV